METIEFQRILTLGLGRAVLYLRNHDAHPYREIILDASLHNRAHDPQVEGSRASYMLDVMRASGDISLFADAVLQSLSNADDDWDTLQRFQLARLLAQNGHPDSRQAMYSAFEARKLRSSDIATEFIELDRIQGLLFAVGQIGMQLTGNPEQWADSYLLEEARDICGREAVDAALKDAAEADDNVRAYLEAVKGNSALRADVPRPNPKDLTYNQIRSLIETKQAGGLLRKWAQTASDCDLEDAAHDLTQEHDPQRLKSCFKLFWKRRFPLGPAPLLRFVELQDGPVPRHALRALANLEDESIRRLAFRLIEIESPLRSYSIDLLVNNFCDGDHRTVESWCNAENDPDVVNAFDRSLRDFFAAHPDADTEKRLLRSFYEREPCAHCRCYIVERLIHLNGLTADIRRECEYDSYEETRSLVTARTIRADSD